MLLLAWMWIKIQHQQQRETSDHEQQWLQNQNHPKRKWNDINWLKYHEFTITKSEPCFRGFSFATSSHMSRMMIRRLNWTLNFPFDWILSFILARQFYSTEFSFILYMTSMIIKQVMRSSFHVSISSLQYGFDKYWFRVCVSTRSADLFGYLIMMKHEINVKSSFKFWKWAR